MQAQDLTGSVSAFSYYYFTTGYIAWVISIYIFVNGCVIIQFELTLDLNMKKNMQEYYESFMELYNKKSKIEFLPL